MVLVILAFTLIGFLIVTHVRDHVVGAVRAGGEMVLSIFEAPLHAIEHVLDGLSILLARAWRGLRDHHGAERTTFAYWAGWSVLVPLIAAVLVAIMVAADYILASRIGYLLGLNPGSSNLPVLNKLLGLLYVTMGATLGIAWADAHGVSPAGESLFFARLSDEGRARLAKWLRVAVALVLVDAMVLMLWTVEAALLDIDDPVSAGVFLLLFAVLVNVALIVALLPALHVPAVAYVFALAAGKVVLFLVGTLLWAVAFVIARIVGAIEALIDLAAAIGRKTWNLALSKHAHLQLAEPEPQPLIGANMPRPRLVHPADPVVPTAEQALVVAGGADG